jgi:hypothetical protein
VIVASSTVGEAPWPGDDVAWDVELVLPQADRKSAAIAATRITERLLILIVTPDFITATRYRDG